MLTCRRMRGLIAASVYDDLSEEENTVLSRHLAACPKCRFEAQSLRRLAAGIPVAGPALDKDMLPGLRARVAAPRPWGSRPVMKLAFAGASVAAVMALCVYTLLWRVPDRPYDAATDQETRPNSLVAEALAQADAAVRNRDFVTAYRLLSEAVALYPEDPLAGAAQLQCAEIAFAELRWYPEAYEAYETLARQYPRVFTKSVTSITRRDLLAEAREGDYASLYALDAARRNMADPFRQVEKVIARYPGTFVASLAANELAELMKSDKASGLEKDEERVAALACAREQCTEPNAINQLDFEIACCYWEHNDLAKARDHFHRVEQGGNTVLAQLARDSLETMNLAGLPPD